MKCQCLSWEDPQEKEMATCSNILAWKIPRRKELVGYSLRGHKELDMTETEYTHTSCCEADKIL